MRIRNYHDTDLGPLDHRKGAVILNEAYSRLKDEVEWVSAGTALGLYRDGDFIPGDTDVDIAIVAYVGIEEKIKKIFSDYELLRDIYLDDKVMQLAFAKDNIVLDLYFHWKNEGDNRYFNCSEFGIQIMPDYIYEGVKEQHTKYGDFNFPNPPEEYFEIRYGMDWRIPQDVKPIFYVPQGGMWFQK